MPRKSRSTGLGRGNGAGSTKTQFLADKPSANSKGRPRKRKVSSYTLPREIAQHLLLERLWVTTGYRDDGTPIRKKMRRIDAIMENLINKLSKATIRDYILFLNAFGGFDGELAAQHEPSPDMIADICRELAKEAQIMEERDAYTPYSRVPTGPSPSPSQ